MADFDDEESSGDEDSSQDEMEENGNDDVAGSEADEVQESVAVDDMIENEDLSPGQRFPDMPQTAVAPREIPNINLFPARCEELLAPPFAEVESSKFPYAILCLGIFLFLLSMIS